MNYPNIEAELARLGIGKEQLARKVGVSRSTLHSWFKRGNIPQKALEIMADLLHCSVDYLLGRAPYERKD